MEMIDSRRIIQTMDSIPLAESYQMLTLCQVVRVFVCIFRSISRLFCAPLPSLSSSFCCRSLSLSLSLLLLLFVSGKVAAAVVVVGGVLLDYLAQTIGAIQEKWT